MKQLSSLQSIIFQAGALLMLAGALAGIVQWPYFPHVYAVGAVGFASMQMLQRYEGRNIAIRRLRRIMIMSDVLFLLAAVLMFAMRAHVTEWLYYLYSINVNWVVVLLIAAVLQLYAVFRIDSELKKEAKKL